MGRLSVTCRDGLHALVLITSFGKSGLAVRTGSALCYNRNGFFTILNWLLFEYKLSVFVLPDIPYSTH